MIEEHEKILAYIQQPGYRTKTDIFQKFSKDKEIVQMGIDFFVDKKIMGKVNFISQNKEDTLFYIISREK